MIDVRVGLPYLPSAADHVFLATVLDLGASPLISVGSLYRPATGWRRAPLTAWRTRPALDSAGFVAQARFGGYRWSVAEYVGQVVANFAGAAESESDPPRWALPFPWAWWSAPDFCCEPEIAGHAREVARRVDATTEAYRETLSELVGWRQEGETEVPDPLPVLQGRQPADYLRSAEALGAAIDDAHDCTCPADPEACGAGWHRAEQGLPDLVGVGSVCRRSVEGPEGVLAIVRALDAALPPRVRLHLFGVKSEALAQLGAVGDRRVASVDSAAWDRAARWEAVKAGVPNDLKHRASALRQWFGRQVRQLQAGELLDLVAGQLAGALPAGLTPEDLADFIERHRGTLARQAARAIVGEP